jgi:hypothetical protein
MLFIDAGDACYQLNNFNSLFEITTGLSAPCIRQLNTTWGLVSAASVEKYQVLMQVCSPEDNYRNYRQAFALAEGQPRLPCSFILVKDLFTIEEAMKSIEDGLVNWQKYRKVHKAISEALERQNLNYLPADGSSAAGISRKGKGALRHDRKVQLHIRHRLDTYVLLPDFAKEPRQRTDPNASLLSWIGSARIVRCSINWRAMPTLRRASCLSIASRRQAFCETMARLRARIMDSTVQNELEVIAAAFLSKLILFDCKRITTVVFQLLVLCAVLVPLLERCGNGRILRWLNGITIPLHSRY